MKAWPTKRIRSGSSELAVLVAGGFVALAFWSLGAPAPQGAGASAVEFSAARAMEHVEQISQEPHPIGTPAIARVRAYIISGLEKLGLEPDLQEVVAPDYYGAGAAEITLVNIAARIPGSDSTEAVALMAHYDTDPSTPGANDNGAAVGTLLEVGRAVLARPQVRNDLILLFTDGEEPAPRYGAAGFVAGHSWLDDIGLIVNFEAVGGSGPSLLLEVSGPQQPIVAGFADAASNPAAYSFLAATVDLMGGTDTDFAPFREAGVPGLNFAYMHGSPIYHTMNDSPERVDLSSVQHHGSHAMALLERFGSDDLSVVMAGGQSVYFTLARRVVVNYPAGWSGPLALLALVALGGSVNSRRRRGGSVRSVALGFGAALLAVVGTAIGAALVWRGVVALRPTPAIGESYLYLVLMALLAAAGFLRLCRRTDPSRVDLGYGTMAVWVLLAVVTGLWVQGAGYLFVWPAIAGAIAMWRAGVSSEVEPSSVRLTGVAAIAICLMLPAVDFFFQFAQPRPGNTDSEVLDLVGLPVALTLLVVMLLHSVWSGLSYSTQALSRRPTNRDGLSA